MQDGLNVLTGETGAGKTMLAKALEVLLGARAPKAVVRPGAKAAYIEAVFSLPQDFKAEGELGEILGDLEGELVIARRIAAEGRSRCLIDGRTVSLENLRELAERLVVFYGQHEGRDLVLEKVQTQLLDSSGDAKGDSLYHKYLDSRMDAIKANREFVSLTEAQAHDSRQLDLARYELQELQQLAPQEGEETSLHSELIKLSGAVGGAQSCSASYNLLAGNDDSIAMLLAQATRSLEEAGEPAHDLALRLANAQAEIDDITSDLQRLSENWEADPERQLEVEARLSLLNSLARKHGVSADQLPQIQADLAAQVEQADLAPEILHKAQQQAEKTLVVAMENGKKLSDWRTKQSPKLGKKITGVLGELAMEGAEFAVTLSPVPGQGIDLLGQSGLEKVMFTLCSNPGLPAQPLSQVASGGEISRLMLALIAEARPGEQAVLVLDEPDVGLGGHTAHGVAARLRSLSSDSQLLVISHLPQIAAKADRILCIEKSSDGKETLTTVRGLQNEDEILDELCRMAGHKPDDQAARKAAASLR